MLLGLRQNRRKAVLNTRSPVERGNHDRDGLSFDGTSGARSTRAETIESLDAHMGTGGVGCGVLRVLF
jgi:hypothetical protein